MWFAMVFVKRLVRIAGIAASVVALGYSALQLAPKPHAGAKNNTHIQPIGLEQAVRTPLCSHSFVPPDKPSAPDQSFYPTKPSGIEPEPVPAQNQEPTELTDFYEEENCERNLADLGLFDMGISRHPVLPLDYAYLMSDEEFTDTEYVTADEIQDYLESINSCLRNPIGGILFSDDIVRLADKYQINPMLLLARAQVEKSVVKKASATPEQLAELMGYAIPDNGSRADTPKGFAAQLDNAARILRKRFDEYSSPQRIPVLEVNYRTEVLNPKNAATYSLMRYTPHTINTKLSCKKGGGNYLFRNVFDGFKRDIEEFR